MRSRAKSRRSTAQRKTRPGKNSEILVAADDARKAGIDPARLLRRAARAEVWAREEFKKGRRLGELLDSVGFQIPDPLESPSVVTAVKALRRKRGSGLSGTQDTSGLDVLALRPMKSGRPAKSRSRRGRERYTLLLRGAALEWAASLDRELAARVTSEAEIRRAAEAWLRKERPDGVHGAGPRIVAAAIAARRKNGKLRGGATLRELIETELFRRAVGEARGQAPIAEQAARYFGRIRRK